MRRHIEKSLRKPENRSEYRDERWAGAAPGAWGTQPGILLLPGRLGLNPGAAPAGNVIFTSSRNLDELDGFNRIANACWPFHRAVIDTIEPKVVLRPGGAVADFVKAKTGANEQVGEFIETNNRGRSSRAFRNRRRCR